MKHIRGLIVAAFAIVLAACATATVIPVGNTRASIDPSQVRLYVQPPAHYEVVGLLQGNSQYEGTGQGGINDTIAKLKEQAAKLGANGVLLGKMGQQYLGSTGGSDYLGWGVSTSSATAAYSKTIDAQAIYVPQGALSGADAGSASSTAQDGAWPLQLPQFDIADNCQRGSANVQACIASEQSARTWLTHHTTTVQIAGACSQFAQQDQSYAMIQACVQQREGTQR